MKIITKPKIVSKLIALFLVLTISGYASHLDEKNEKFQNSNNSETYMGLKTSIIQTLTNYAKANLRYFTSSQANNKITGFTHSFYGPPTKFRVKKNEKWIEEDWLLTRGYGSWVNINEVTLRFVSLAVGYKMGWINKGNDYFESWGQIKKGLETLRYMQTSGDTMQFCRGTFHRTYLTTISKNGLYDQDRTMDELRRDPKENIQSSDDNGLPYMNLLVLEGLVKDSSVSIPDKDSIVSLCEAIRSSIDLKAFIVRNKVVFNITNGTPSSGVWDRMAAEGPIILTAMYLSGQITEDEFITINKSMEKKHVAWKKTDTGQIIIDNASFHSAMFIHGLRMFHGIPVTDDEYPGLNYFATSTIPVVQANIDYNNSHSFFALGSQVMTQAFLGVPLFNMISPNDKQAQFTGNENGLVPVYGSTLSRATAPHGWFVALARSKNLKNEIIDKLISYMGLYQDNFFHNGSDSDNDLGWEATIPWTPDDHSYAWIGSDNQIKYSDWGRPFEALNSAFIVLSIFDALSEKPLASYNVKADLLKKIADNLDNRSSISNPPPKITSFSPTIGQKDSTITINGYNLTNTFSIEIGGKKLENFTVISDREIVATVVGSSGKIIVSTPNGIFTSKDSFTMISRTAKPFFNPLPGNYSNTVTVKISSTTPDVKIFWSTNDGVDWNSDSLVVISSTTILKAKAQAIGMIDSDITFGEYVIQHDNIGALQVGTGYAEINSTATDNFSIKTKFYLPNANFFLGIGDGANGTVHQPLSWNAGMLILNGSGNAWFPSSSNKVDSNHRADMVIDGTGKIGVRNINPEYVLDVNGRIRGQNITNSDSSLKKDVVQIPNALQRLIKLRGVNFRWIDSTNDNGSELQMGLIAQEVQRVFPELVSTDHKNIKSVYYSNFVGCLVESIKDLKKENDDLQERIKAIENKMK